METLAQMRCTPEPDAESVKGYQKQKAPPGCLIKYKWIKLPRDIEIDAKGLMTCHCCAMGEEECTEVYVVPDAVFLKWLEQEPNIPPAGRKLYESVYEGRTENAP